MKSRDASLIEINQLARSFKTNSVLRSVSAAISSGDRAAIIGPNGSGKTTLLRCLSGAVAPSRGVVRIGGHVAGSYDARRLVGASLSQERAFYLRLTGHDNLIFYARLRGARAKEAASQVSAMVDELELTPFITTRVDRCSSGMVQLLSFARALLGSPRVLLLDEPTRSLDDSARVRLWSALDRRPELAVVIATHRGDDLDRCTQRLRLPS